MSYDEWGLAAAMKTAMAQAWDEGYEAAHLDALNGYTDYAEYGDTPNPYQDTP